MNQASDTLLQNVNAELSAARAMAANERAAWIEAQADAARGRSQVAHADALIALLHLQIEKLRREIYGTRSEKTSRLIGQLELALEDMTAHAAEAEIAAKAAPGSTPVKAFERRHPAKKPLPNICRESAWWWKRQHLGQPSAVELENQFRPSQSRVATASGEGLRSNWRSAVRLT